MEVEQEEAFSVVDIDAITSDKDLRLEAGAFGREAGRAASSIEGGKYSAVKFGELAESYMFGRSVKLMRAKSPYPFFQPSSVTDIKPKTDGYLYSRKQSEIDELRIHEGQILLSRSGTVGNVTYVSKTLGDKYLSPDMIRIDCRNPEDSGYIYTYLKSSACQKILHSLAFGAVIQHINPEHLNDIPVPNAPSELRRKIHSLILQSYTLRDESNILLDEAETLLIRSLGLPTLESLKREDKVLAFEAEYSALAASGRFEASYHDPLFVEIAKRLQEGAEEVTTIGDERVSRKILLPGRFKRVYVDEGYGAIFIGGKQRGELDPADKKYLAFSQHEDRIREELTIHENMILITCSGTIGNVALVPEHWDGWTMTHDIIRVLPASEDIAGYAYVFLASEWGRELVRRYKYGAVVEHIELEHVASVPFPILRDKAAQYRINALALAANEQRTRAYNLEREAVNIMEREIINPS